MLYMKLTKLELQRYCLGAGHMVEERTEALVIVLISTDFTWLDKEMDAHLAMIDGLRHMI